MRRWPNVGLLLGQRRTRRLPNVGLLLAHRLRRWPYSKPTLGQRLVFAGHKLILCHNIIVLFT